MIDPKDVIRNLSVSELNKTADEYFAGIDDYSHLFSKPFSDFRETACLMESLSFLFDGLHLSKGLTVVDFAAGSCWLSRLLNQLQCCTISVDVSKHALEIGKKLFEYHPIPSGSISEPVFLLFDGYSINLESESVDRIICNDGFHHVPNQNDVLREFFRILKPGGVIGFSEPGIHHSQTPQSQYEMQNYCVLENDINVQEIFSTARTIGFTDCKIAALCRPLLDLRQHQSLMDADFQIDFSNQVMHEMRNNGINKNIFFLHKGPLLLDSRSAEHLQGNLEILSSSFSLKGNNNYLEIHIRVANTGSSVWLTQSKADIGVVKIGVHLLNEMNQIISLGWKRFTLSRDLLPGETLTHEIKIDLPNDQSGSFRLSFDLVSESICWFEQLGHVPPKSELICI